MVREDGHRQFSWFQVLALEAYRVLEGARFDRRLVKLRLAATGVPES